jgi:hypothetical protein
VALPGGKAAFAFEAGTTYLDHGGFGVAPREVLQVAFGGGSRRYRRGMDARRFIAGCNDKSDGSRSGTGGNGMSDHLTDSQIALPCDIGAYRLPKATADQKCAAWSGFSPRVTWSRRRAIGERVSSSRSKEPSFLASAAPG